MKKTFISLLLVLCVILTLGAFGTSAAASENVVYKAPQATSAPKVDGKDSDACWKSALTIDLSPSAVVKNGGWAQNKSGKTATGTVKIVWTDGKNGGLYFLWSIKDSTQSFCYDKGVSVINAMDCCQVALDPMYSRRAKLASNDCMVFTFAPYNCVGGNGFSVETGSLGGGTWYEHYCWVGKNDSIGVKQVVTLSGKKDTSKENNRKFLVSGYTMEVFIPFTAMQVKNGYPTAKVGTKIGIGLLLVDYDFLYSKWSKAGAPTDDWETYQKLMNISSDYTNGTGTNRNNICARPKNYNTLYLADASGNLPGGSGTTTTTAATTAATVPVISDDAKLSDVIATAELLDSTLYTADSFATVTTALTAAKAFTDADTSAEAVAAKEALVKAVDGLVTVTPAEDVSTASEEETTTKSEVEEATTAPAEETETTSFPLWIIIVAVVVIAAAVVIIIVVSKKKKG